MEEPSREVDDTDCTVDSADEAFAHAEGEDDRSLESWRRERRRYWERTTEARGARWSETDEIVFEYFAVVWPPQHADGPSVT